MKKIAIITLHSFEPNYGNCLQNYAVQKVFNSIGYSATTELYHEEYFSKTDGIKLFVSRLFCRVVPKLIAKKNYYYKKKSFSKFYNKYINSSINKSVSDISTQYDYYSVGSDQVWNYKWYKRDDFRRFLLTFSESKNKISFSASFGIEAIDDNWKEKFSNELNKFKALSVREETGAKIVKELTGREAIVLIDPTMMLTNEEWRKISRKPKGIKENGYILTYFLSPMSYEAREQLMSISDGRLVYELMNGDDEIASKSGPSEFIWLFDHADLIITDSFHACVFSFLFNKPFVVYDRNWSECNMNSRIETLLKKFHLERKYINSELKNDIWEHDYSRGYLQLEKEKKKAFAFIMDALGE